MRLFLALRMLSPSPPVKAREVRRLSWMVSTLRLEGLCRKYLILLLLRFFLGGEVPESAAAALLVP
jgi:hypothetical protein